MKKKAISLVAVCALALSFASCAPSAQNASGGASSEAASSGASGEGGFRVLSVSPQGELLSGTIFPSVQVQFSEPVVALEKLGEPITSCDALSIEPAVRGVFRWYGTALLSFDCEERLIPQKAYTIRVNPRLKSRSGNAVSGRLEYEFRTEPLGLDSITPAYSVGKASRRWFDPNDVASEYVTDIAVRFSNKVRCAVVSQFIRISVEGSADAQFSAVQLEENSILLKLKEALPNNAQVDVRLLSGAMPDKDCVATSSEQKRSFHTLRPLELRSVTGGRELQICFNHRLKEEIASDVYKSLSFSNGIGVEEGQVEVRGSCIIVRGINADYGSEYEFSLGAGCVRDTYGMSYGKPIQKKVSVGDADSFANFRRGFEILEASFGRKTAFDFQNILEGSWYKVSAIGSDKGRTFSLEPSAGTRNRRMVQVIDLNQYEGAVRIEYKVATRSPWRKDGRSENSGVNFIQFSDIALTSHCDRRGAAVMVSRLSDASPVSGAKVSVFAIKNDFKSDTEFYEAILSGRGSLLAGGVSGADGMASVKFPAVQKSSRNSFYIKAEFEGKSLVQPLEFSDSEAGSRVYMASDRSLYRPGEAACVFVAEREWNSGRLQNNFGGRDYEIELSGYERGKKVSYGRQKGSLSGEGAARAQFQLPEGISPGRYEFSYSRGGKVLASEPVSVQYFERLRFEASAKIEESTYFAGDSIPAQIGASYLGGGALAGASAKVTWMRQESDFAPSAKEFEGYAFGARENSHDGSYFESESLNLSERGQAFSTGHAKGRFYGSPYSYSLAASVVDSGNQMIGAGDSVLVHPASFYIGLKNEGGRFVKKGSSAEFSYLLATPDEKFPQKDRIKSKEISWVLEHRKFVEKIRTDQFGFEYSEWEEETEEEQKGTLKIPSGAAKFSLKPKDSGSYALVARASDYKGREAVTRCEFFVTSSDYPVWRMGSHSEYVELEPEKPEYSAGETARILLSSSLPSGRYLVTVERDGLLSERVIELSEPSTTIELKIEEDWVPCVYLRVSSFSARTDAPPSDYDGEDKGRPFYVSQSCRIGISRKSRQFALDLKFEPVRRPGEKARFEIKAEKDGKPVPGAELLLVAADRGVLDLAGYHIKNPAEFFYSNLRWNELRAEVTASDTRRYLGTPVTYNSYSESAFMRELRFKEAMYESADGGIVMDRANAMPTMAKSAVAGKAMGADDSAEAAPQLRENFNPLAAFIGGIVTDKDGRATAEFTLPDTLTEYRVTVVALKDDEFSIEERPLKVANPVSARTFEPQSLRPRDVAECGVILTNLGSKAEQVRVSLKAESGASVAGNAVLDVKAAPLCDTTAKFRILVGEFEDAKDGKVEISYSIEGADRSLIYEVVKKSIPVEEPHITESVTTVGQLPTESRSVTETLVPPKDDSATLGVRLDSTQVGSLLSAAEYLKKYPYGCVEQKASALIPYILFGKEEDGDVVAKQMSEFAGLQNPDGGFGYWPGQRESSLAVSLRVAEAVALAKRKGFSLGKDPDVGRLLDFIAGEASRLAEGERYGYAEAASLYALSLFGRKADSSRLQKIVSESRGISELAFAGIAALNSGLGGIARDAADKIRNTISLTVRGVSIQADVPWSVWHFCNSNAERHALALQLFVRLDPHGIYAQHLASHLSSLQKNGFWHNTASTARVLIAIDEYVMARNLDDTDMTASVKAGGKVILSGSFKGRNSAPVEARLNPGSKEIPIEVSQEGIGSLSYTICMTYPIAADEQVPRDEGLCVYSEISDAETGQAVSGRFLVSGRIYRQKVFVSTTKERSYVAVRAPVPAGAQILNSALAPSGAPLAPVLPVKKLWPGYFSRQEVYDAEVRCFWDYMPIGSRSFEFLFRAVRPGEYQTPAVTAECMYEPEVFGRAGGRVWGIGE